jgi:hypothetical protein
MYYATSKTFLFLGSHVCASRVRCWCLCSLWSIISFLICSVDCLFPSIHDAPECWISSEFYQFCINLCSNFIQTTDGVFERPCFFHDPDRIFLDLNFFCPLLEDVEEPGVPVGCMCDGMNHWKRELPFCEILTKAFVLVIDTAVDIEKIVHYLEIETQQIDQRDHMPLKLAEGLNHANS